MTINIREKDDQVEIAIQGRFDFKLHEEFRAAYRHRDGKATCYSVDLREVQYLDSSALGMLLLLREHVGNNARKVALRNCTQPVRELLELARFDRLFTMH